MAFFDIFIPRKKKYNDFVTNHYDDVLAYINNSYEVYNDMRQDHKTLFNEYQQQYEIEIKYLVDDNSLETLSDDAKKYILKNKEHVLLLSKTFKIYATKKERVILLSKRFSVNNIFNKAAFKFVKKNNIEEMTEEDYDTILDNYEYMVKKMTYVQNIKKKKQKELRDRLQKRIQARNQRKKEEREKIIAEKKKKEEEERLKEIIEEVKKRRLEALKRVKEAESSGEVYPFVFGSDVFVDSMNIAYSLYDHFKYNGIFMRVVHYLLPDMHQLPLRFDASIIWKLNDNRDVFEKEAKFFSLLDKVPKRKEYYILFIKNKGIKDPHEGIEYCLYNIGELDAFIEATSANNVSFDIWKQNQNYYNKLIKSGVESYHRFTIYMTKMYVDIISNGEKHRNVLSFSHLVYFDMAKTPKWRLKENMHIGQFYITTGKACPEACREAFRVFAVEFSKQFKRNEAIFFFGDSGADNPKKLNDNNFYYLKNSLRVKCYDDWDDLPTGTGLKCVVIIEVVSNIDHFRSVSKKISKLLPQAAIIYMSIYGELTDIQIKNKYGEGYVS